MCVCAQGSKYGIFLLACQDCPEARNGDGNKFHGLWCRADLAESRVEPAKDKKMEGKALDEINKCLEQCDKRHAVGFGAYDRREQRQAIHMVGQACRHEVRLRVPEEEVPSLRQILRSQSAMFNGGQPAPKSAYDQKQSEPSHHDFDEALKRAATSMGGPQDHWADDVAKPSQTTTKAQQEEARKAQRKARKRSVPLAACRAMTHVSAGRATPRPRLSA